MIPFHDWVPLARPFALLLLATGASAQDFNFDFGSATGTPSVSYGGAAAQPGHWNQFAGQALLDTQGNPVTILAELGFFLDGHPFFADDATTLGDDGVLLDDGWAGMDAVVLGGLRPGFYSFYVNAWTPQVPNAKVRIDTASDAAPSIDVGGPWTGVFEPGITHAVLDVFVKEHSSILLLELGAGLGHSEARDLINALQIVEHEASPPPITYCSAAPNSLGCLPTWSLLGVPNGPAGAPFELRWGKVPGNALGLLLYTTAGAAAAPAQTVFGELCLQPGAIYRTPSVDLGGASTTCSGALVFDFNAFSASQTADPTLVPGATVDLQAWYRDPPNPGGANLSSALRFTLLP